MNTQAYGPIRQVAYIVADLDAAIRHWMDFAGIGPWTVYKNATMRGHCRGVETAVKMNVGLSYQGEVQIELIQVNSKTPSPYQDADGRSLIGMHHIAWLSQDIDADVAKAKQRGLAPAFEASNGVVRVAYMESAAEPGLLLEFIEAAPVVLENFASGMKAAREWDGNREANQVIDFEA
ncbi:VOC family protein [Nevskia soli]|uniref:VOC family protein n=1 Tax=Nevskia soli TaxID=418856 RepID=UPI0004A756FE|nr:VOC family protein [Nevskia soli]